MKTISLKHIRNAALGIVAAAVLGTGLGSSCPTAQRPVKAVVPQVRIADDGGVETHGKHPKLAGSRERIQVADGVETHGKNPPPKGSHLYIRTATVEPA